RLSCALVGGVGPAAWRLSLDPPHLATGQELCQLVGEFSADDQDFAIAVRCMVANAADATCQRVGLGTGQLRGPAGGRNDDADERPAGNRMTNAVQAGKGPGSPRAAAAGGT